MYSQKNKINQCACNVFTALTERGSKDDGIDIDMEVSLDYIYQPGTFEFNS